MDKFGYIAIALLMLPLWSIIYIRSKRLRVRMRNTGIYVGLLAIATEPLFLADYWSPPPLFEIAGFYAVEDFIYSFISTGIAISIYNFIFDVSYQTDYKKRKKTMVILAIGILASFLISNLLLGYNTVFSISYTALVATLIMTFIRKDLFFPALFTGTVVVVILAIIYIIIFNFFLTSYWQEYWKMVGTPYEYFIFGIPWTEYLWYFSSSSFIAIVYDFASGTAKKPNTFQKKR